MKERKVRKLRFVLPALFWLCFMSFAITAFAGTKDDAASAERKLAMPDITAQFEKALQLAAAENWRQAETILRELHEAWPENREIANNLAVAYFYLGRIDKATELLASVLAADPATRTLFVNLQMLYGYSTAEAYRQGLGKEEKTKMPGLLLSRTLSPQFSQQIDQQQSSGASTTTAPAE